ncbi:MAG: hypothetical protein AAF702_42380 [Chloroflexota bacterium]
MSFGYDDAHDPPYPEVVNEARNQIKATFDQLEITSGLFRRAVDVFADVFADAFTDVQRTLSGQIGDILESSKSPQI